MCLQESKTAISHSQTDAKGQVQCVSLSYSSGFLPDSPCSLACTQCVRWPLKGGPVTLTAVRRLAPQPKNLRGVSMCRSLRRRKRKQQETIRRNAGKCDSPQEKSKSHNMASPTVTPSPLSPPGSAALIALHQCSLKFQGEPSDKYLRGWGHTPHTLHTHSSSWIRPPIVLSARRLCSLYTWGVYCRDNTRRAPIYSR